MSKLKALKPAPASEPAPFVEADVTAMQAFFGGVANEGQQRRVRDWILHSACGLSSWPYRDSPRETDVALGRQFVGQQIVGLSKVNVSKLKQREENKNG